VVVAGPTLEPGTKVGRYRIDGVLGSGSTGVVYAAHDPELDRDVALKLLHRTPLGDDQLAVIAKLRHPNIAAIHDVGRFGDQRFLVMQRVTGSTLRAWVAGKPRQAVRAAFVEVGNGLAAAHEAGVVHGDFTLDNVLVDRDGRPLVTDVGLARATQDDDVRAFRAALREVLGDDTPSRLRDAEPRSMRELVDLLQREPARSRVRSIAAAVIALAAITGGVTAWRTTRRPAIAATCDARAELAGVWDDAIKQRLGGSWRATPDGARAWPRMQQAIDRYAAAWVDASDASCKEHATPYQRRCFSSIAFELRAVIDELAVPKQVDAAERTIASLPSIGECNNRAPVAPVPADSWTRLEVERLRGELAIADGESIAGKHADAARAIDAVGARARLLDFKPLTAEVQYSRATNLANRGAPDATEAMHDAAVQAEASGDEPLAVRAWLGLASAVIGGAGDLTRAREYAGYAKGALDRLGGNAVLETRLELFFGSLDKHDNKPTDARRHYQRAAELAKTSPAMYLDALGGLAWVDATSGDYVRAIAELRALVEQSRAVYGDAHPDTVNAYIRLGAGLLRMGKADDALAADKQADELAQQVYGPSSPLLQGTAHHLAVVYHALDRPADAEREARRAYRIATDAYGPDHLYTTGAEVGLASLLVDDGQPREAIQRLRHALGVLRTASGIDKDQIWDVTTELSRALAAAGQTDDAMAAADQAIAGLTAIEGPASADLAAAYQAKGQALAAAHRTPEAIGALERSLDMFTKTGGRPDEIARARATLDRIVVSHPR
jgi:hypothetical protein